MAVSTINELCTALGVPPRDWPLFVRWADDAVPTDAFNAYVDVLVADHCAHPADNLLSWLITMEIDGAWLTAEEIRQFVSALLTPISTGRRAHTVGDDWTRFPAP